MVHVDVKKLGRIPDGGGHKVLGRQAGRATRSSMGFDYVHSAVDDHSRLAYSEIHGDEKADTCAGFLRRAAAFFAASGIDRIERVLTDNAWPHRKSFAWQQALADLGATGKLTRAYRPQTNGKVERFNRTLLEEWAYLRSYTSNTERTTALADFLHTYNHHRCHTALRGQPPISRGASGSSCGAGLGLHECSRRGAERPSRSPRGQRPGPRSVRRPVHHGQAATELLRATAGRDPLDRQVTELIGELSTRSADFSTRWAKHDVDVSITTYTAHPGTPSADGLTLLATWAATQKQPQTVNDEAHRPRPRHP
ncbi:Integrase core domain-containing protein [Streptomyces sp. 3214.6]|nr:Integrase core domain-containing protein [Streptomyces sp. 3214.6]